jgi:Bacterial Ig-like domain
MIPRAWRVSLAGLVCAIAAMWTVALAPQAIAAAPVVTITSPANGTTAATATPAFSGAAGQAAGDLPTITLTIHAGASASGAVVEQVQATAASGAWALTATGLANGTYTAQAQQSNQAGTTGTSAAVSFSVNSPGPLVTITSPANGSTVTVTALTLAGTAGTQAGDTPVTVRLYVGSVIGPQAPVQSTTAAVINGSWSVSVGGLIVGSTYTVQATQSDSAHNLGVSAASTFTVSAPSSGQLGSPTSSPPVASFIWLPVFPHVGDTVTLLSTSTAGIGSAIVSSVWDVLGAGSFAVPGPAITTTFTTAGTHVVSLRVTDADGQASVVQHAIAVAPAPLTLMRPFPVVSMVGTLTSNGARISSLTVVAPIGARVQGSCLGKGCPVRSQTSVAATKHANGTATVRLQRFQGVLRAGTVLRISVTMSGQIGKFTSFTIRRNHAPKRTDLCLPFNGKPAACPS